MEKTQTYHKPVNLLTTENHKTIKGEKLGFKTYILYMAPFTANSKGVNLCPHASAGCVQSCLVGSGFGGMYPMVAEGRKNKAEYFLANRTEFLAQLDFEIARAIRVNKGKNKVAVRLNGTSDIRWEKFKVRDGKNLFELYPQIKFYDYTKNHLRFDQELPKNYSLVFSRSETNEEKALELLSRGHNVAVVFNKLPKTYKGYKVVDGDISDLRFKDKKGVIIGLKYKKNTGKNGAEKNKAALTSGFVVDTINVSSLPKQVNKVAMKMAA